MAVGDESVKVLGQVYPVAATVTDLYTVPTSRSTVTTLLTACNQSTSTTPTKVRVKVLPSGGTNDQRTFLAYDVPVGANSTIEFNWRLTLAAGDKVQVQVDTQNVSFNLFGQEVATA